MPINIPYCAKLMPSIESGSVLCISVLNSSALKTIKHGAATQHIWVVAQGTLELWRTRTAIVEDGKGRDVWINGIGLSASDFFVGEKCNCTYCAFSMGPAPPSLSKYVQRCRVSNSPLLSHWHHEWRQERWSSWVCAPLKDFRNRLFLIKGSLMGRHRS